MIVTTYTCDRCGHTQGDSDQMWNIGIFVTHNHYYVSASQSPHKSVLWCRRCAEEFHMLPTKDPVIKESVAPTFEDILREIIREEIGDV